MLIKHSSVCPLNKFDIAALLALVPSHLRGEFNPGPHHEVKEIRQGVVWLHCIDGKGDLINVSKEHLAQVFTLTLMLEYCSTNVNVASTSSTDVTSPHESDH